jgi:uncharacterized RDD family membrane protein YckC
MGIYLMSMMYLFVGDYRLRFGEASIGFAMLAIFIPLISYTLLSEVWLNGQTIGKKVFRIKVVSLDGGEPTLSQYLLRWFLRFYEWGFIIFFLFWGNPGMGFLILFIGGIISIIIISTSKRNQRLGDIVAGTVVVNTVSKFTVNDTIFMHVAENNYKVKFPQVMRLSDRDINTIKNVLTQVHKTNDHQMCNRVAGKVKEVLDINTDMFAIDFLEKIMADYNYLATRE